MDNNSKKEIMFDRMREKKKEVKIVRRIVFAIALITTYCRSNRGSVCLQIRIGGIATTRSGI